jgi:hypothetical protein
VRAAFAEPYHAGEPLFAHGGTISRSTISKSTYDKASARDAERLIHDLRRMSRSTGASTRGAGPESVATHGIPIR